MKNTLFLNHNNETIVMDRTFARKAINARSEEYELLQRVRQDYPKYTVTQRHIKTNPSKKTYRGLTYDWMEDYILTHGDNDKRLANWNKYTEMRLLSECHGQSFRYPYIKSWFLNMFPEVATYGTDEQPSVFEQGHPQIENATSEPLAIAG